MEIIAVILMIVFALVSASDRKKKAAKQAENRANQSAAAGKPVADGRSARQMSMAERQARLEELRQKKAARAVPVTPGNAEATFESSLTELKQLLNVTAQPSHAEGDSMLADADCAGGSMPHDHAEGGSALADEDCFGGSMEHTHTEGVSRNEQARRMAAIDDGTEDVLPERIDARALRRAVVMAEVLGKPRALQRTRYSA